MMINFCSFEDEQLKLVRKALSSFNALDSTIGVTKFVVGGDTLKIPRSMKILCPFLSDLSGSVPLNNEELIIIFPDCSSTSLQHLIELLTTGFTESCKDLEAVVEVANILRIDIKNLVTGGKCNPPEGDLDLEDGEIVDSDESLSQEPHSEQGKTFGSIKVASFSKSFISVPNIISDNFEELSLMNNKHQEGLLSSTSDSGYINSELLSRNNNIDNLSAPTSTNNKVFAPTSNNDNILFAPTSNNKLIAPTSTNDKLSAPTSNNNQIFAPQSSNKETPLGSDEKELAFLCPECNRVFANKDGLWLHMKNSKKHRVNNKPISLEKARLALKPESVNWLFKCEICEFRRFRRKDDLNNHLKGVHNWCSGCFSSFKSQESLKSHQKKCILQLLSKK